MPDGLAQGHDTWGARVEPRGSGAYAPALGVVLTIDDLIALARAVLDGPFATSSALEPMDQTRWPRIDIGAFWEHDTRNGGDAVYIVGASGGFAAALLVDRRGGQASMLLSNAEIDWPWSRVLPLMRTLED